MKVTRVSKPVKLGDLEVGDAIVAAGQLMIRTFGSNGGLVPVLVAKSGGSKFTLDSYPRDIKGTPVTITNVEYTS